MKFRVMKFRFNSFESVRYCSDFAPDSRALHTGLIQKIKDTFDVFKGGTPFFTKEGKRFIESFHSDSTLGLFDYLTLGLGRTFDFLVSLFGYKFSEALDDNMRNSEGAKKIGWIVLGILNYFPAILFLLSHSLINGVARNGVSAALTLTVSPLVLLAEGVAKAVASLKAKTILPNRDQIEAKAVNPEGVIHSRPLRELIGNTSLRKLEVISKKAEEKGYTITFKSTKGLADQRFSLFFTDEAYEKLVTVNPNLRRLVRFQHECETKFHHPYRIK